MDKSSTIALVIASLKTDFGHEELRRTLIRGWKETAKGSGKNSVLAQALLDAHILGDEPDPWETNPFKWSFDSQLDQLNDRT